MNFIEVELEGENRVEVDGNINQHIDIVGKALSGEGLAIGDADGAFSLGFGLDFCDERIRGRIFFDQIEVMVIFVRPKGVIGNVCDYPKGEVVESFVQRLRDGGGELGKSQRLDWLHW